MAVNVLLVASITLIYLVVILCLGYLGYKKTREAEDYLVAGRKAHPVVIALSYGATFISTSAIVGFGGQAANLGMGLIWLTVFNIGVGILLAFVVFGKKTREVGQRLRAVTFPDLMGKIYSSTFMQVVSGLVIVVGMPLYSAAVLIGGAQFIKETLGISYAASLIGFAVIVAIYVVFGGLIAVMYTDAVQGAIMLVGMTFLLILTYVILGGVTAAHSALTAIADMVPQKLAEQGMHGWTVMPDFGSPIWYTLVTTLVLGVGIGVLAQPQLVVRFMTAKDNRSLNRAVLVGGPFILMMTGVAFTVGALTNVYFVNTQGKIAIAAAGGNVDAVIPLFINLATPEWFTVVFMVTLLAAAMSTLSSLFHTMGTALICDLWGRGRECALSLKANQAGVIAMIVASVVIAFLMPGSIIAIATAMFMGLCACAFLPVFAVAVYCKNPSPLAAKASLVTGALVWFAWALFVNARYSAVFGLSSALIGKTSVLPFPWSAMDPLIIGLPLSAAVILVLQYLHRPEGAKAGLS
ncbi:MAG TPA: sodium:solute symporter family protein [Methanolinea sp.]|jgi:SSS family solute:Na+ symporter|nr:sodium:solute symporter family protein [Methanolinea sp.]HPC55418.1 sodium:solute symporter family protein [Methanolinea sp.]